ncbi:hypothetical protein [Aquipuribacter nitratireducens]|uniref:Integral membrane protein n=1 Tax=Aquipuribacter nitratireducens TaxID=650104 RepID=A0ABW0GKT7_9MICO
MSSGARRARPTRSGPGRLLVAVYAVLAVGATSRSVYQVLVKFDEAPIAYVLSAVAALVYVVATVALAVDRPAARRVAWVAVGTEAVGVVVVGTVSLARPALFPEPTVWSDFGLGYLLIPLVLPFLGLWWLRRTGRP